jgi:hypothetical protein
MAWPHAKDHTCCWFLDHDYTLQNISKNTSKVGPKIIPVNYQIAKQQHAYFQIIVSLPLFSWKAKSKLWAHANEIFKN